jgi:hypothetical protein
MPPVQVREHTSGMMSTGRVAFAQPVVLARRLQFADARACVSELQARLHISGFRASCDSDRPYARCRQTFWEGVCAFDEPFEPQSGLEQPTVRFLPFWSELDSKPRGAPFANTTARLKTTQLTMSAALKAARATAAIAPRLDCLSRPRLFHALPDLFSLAERSVQLCLSTPLHRPCVPATPGTQQRQGRPHATQSVLPCLHCRLC